MTANFTVQINPDLLRWSIERSGFDPEDLHNRILKKHPVKYFTLNYFYDIIHGKRDPKLSDIKKIDHFLKRGVPFYFLPKIPEENILAEFRSTNEIDLSPEAELLLRKYNELREELDILMEENSLERERKVDLFSTSDAPGPVSNYIRKILDYDPGEWETRTSREVFEYLRRSVEDLGIYVFKDELAEGMRGCVFLGGDLPPLILIRTDDDKNGEIFTLIHEFCHYLLNDEDVLFIEERTNSIEKWCNRVTANFLMTEEEEKEEGITKNNREALLDKTRIEEISKKYKMSKNSIMLKYLMNDIISKERYGSFLDAFISEKVKGSGLGGNFHYTNRDRLSKKFIALAYRSYSEGLISVHDMMEYLRIKRRSRIDLYLEVI